ncbi:hypothetical protein D5F01_LYC24932 [Larimichthys crocea]|uniref:SET domain-containing protein n=1 Tax=Larimichthys crocea TaxID=215358 RepID=A0A6G0HDX7_LARCR|nr:hypothetical protein D5F01_LYC24932 [Larimichthys crocea]
MRVVQSTGAREVGKGVLMAETVRSPFDYREPPTLDSDGDGSKPPPPRGRVCGRKRKGTPVKVCDRAYVTEDEEEESMSEHSYSPACRSWGRRERVVCEDPCSSIRRQTAGFEKFTARTQVRLVVIAIRDIAKGEEITVDYSLTDWGENAMEEEGGPHPLSLSVSDYLTPSWSLSPSSSPLTHSEPSDSDREEDEEEEDDDDDDDDEEEEIEEMRGRMLRRRKKRKLPAVPDPSPSPSRHLATPTTNINNNININIGSSSGATVSRRQHCPYCGRHYRSLARHLETPRQPAGGQNSHGDGTHAQFFKRQRPAPSPLIVLRCHPSQSFLCCPSAIGLQPCPTLSLLPGEGIASYALEHRRRLVLPLAFAAFLDSACGHQEGA